MIDSNAGVLNFRGKLYKIGEMKTVPTKTTYLQMHAPPEAGSLPLPAEVAVQRMPQPTVEQYRFLYNSVGRDYNWIDRNLMAEEALLKIIHDPHVEIFVLNMRGEPAGFAELDRRVIDEVELGYFGLFPSAVGQGLGKTFLRWIIAQAWSYQPRRVWVHTCDLDHPAALPTYIKAGFEVYEERVIEQVIET